MSDHTLQRVNDRDKGKKRDGKGREEIERRIEWLKVRIERREGAKLEREIDRE